LKMELLATTLQFTLSDSSWEAQVVFAPIWCERPNILWERMSHLFKFRNLRGSLKNPQTEKQQKRETMKDE
jgi:hypothetical protein